MDLVIRDLGNGIIPVVAYDFVSCIGWMYTDLKHVYAEGSKINSQDMAPAFLRVWMIPGYNC